MLKKFLSYYRPHLCVFIADLICAFLLSACNMVYPLITRKMMNEFIPDKNIKFLLIGAAVLIGIYLAKYFFNFYIDYFGHVMGTNMQADMRREVFSHLEKLPLKYFDDNKTGTIMSKIVNDLQEVSELAHHGPESLFLSLVTLIGSFFIMFSICKPLTLIIYAFIPFLIVFAVLQQNKMNSAFEESRRRVGEINATLENSISGIRVSKAFTSREKEMKNFSEGNGNFVKAKIRAYRVMADFDCCLNLGMDIIRLAMYTAGGLFVISGKINFADFTAFVLYISFFISPIEALLFLVEQYQDGMTGFKRFAEILDTPAEKDSLDAVELTDVRGDIEFRNVTFAYNEGKNVLTDMSFKIEKGKSLALVGLSGGGKTTICNLIPRFYEISGGEILLDGNDIRGYTLESLRRSVGTVSQDVFLFDSTIYDNILYGKADATEEEVIAAAKRANIHDFIMSLPNGYKTEVGERGIKLSGGQKQRVSIARVFLKNPAVLILDEATSALDNVTEQAIKESLDSLAEGRTSIVVAHRLTTVMNADEILVITDEGIMERGTHSALLNKNGIYAGLWNAANRAETIR